MSKLRLRKRVLCLALTGVLIGSNYINGINSKEAPPAIVSTESEELMIKIRTMGMKPFKGKV